MQSYLLSGGSATSRREYLHNLVTPQIELIPITAEKSSITIKQIQALAPVLSIKARLPRLVWIEEADRMTKPAQNALLKMLEEPPAGTSFYLTCFAPSALLPTVVSRTSLISLNQDQDAIDPTVLTELKNYMALTPGDRLSTIIKRDRSETIAWITSIEQALKSKMKDPNLTLINYTSLGKIASLTLAAHRELLANCSVGLVTQHFLLSLPKTK